MCHRVKRRKHAEGVEAVGTRLALLALIPMHATRGGREGAGSDGWEQVVLQRLC
jgi:hypothetical protein